MDPPDPALTTSNKPSMIYSLNRTQACLPKMHNFASIPKIASPRTACGPWSCCTHVRWKCTDLNAGLSFEELMQLSNAPHNTCSLVKDAVTKKASLCYRAQPFPCMRNRKNKAHCIHMHLKRSNMPLFRQRLIFCETCACFDAKLFIPVHLHACVPSNASYAGNAFQDMHTHHTHTHTHIPMHVYLCTHTYIPPFKDIHKTCCHTNLL